MSDLYPQVMTIQWGAVDASATPTKYVHFGTNVRILGVSLLDTAAHPYTNAASYGTITVLNGGTTGAGTTSVASRSYGGATADAIVATSPYALTMSTADGACNIDDGDVLIIKFTETGTATCGDLTAAVVNIRYALGSGT